MNETKRLFTLRLWPAAETDDGTSQHHTNAPQWHGKIQSLPDCETYYFSNWPDLIRALEAMVSTMLPTMLSTESEENKES